MALSLAGMASCSSLKGSVASDTYRAPDGLFEVTLPALGLGRAIEDGFGAGPDGLRGGYVSFHDDFGRVRAISYEEIPPEAITPFTAPSQVQENLRSYLLEVQVSQLQELRPDTRVSTLRPLKLGDGNDACFAVVEIPEGSPMMVINAEHPQGRRLDTTRGLLAVVRGRLLLTLSAANDDALTRVDAGDSESGSRADGLEEILTRLYAGLSTPSP